MNRKTDSTLLAFVLGAAAIASVARAQQPSDPYAEAARYTFGQPRSALSALESGIRTARPEQLRSIEDSLLRLVQSPDATLDSKVWACTQLRFAGSKESVAVLAGLLGNKDLAPVARLAMLSIHDASVDAALRDAAGKVQGVQKAGVIQAIGARRDTSAVKLLESLAGDNDPAIAASAIAALGNIGNKEALQILKTVKVPDAMKRERANALLMCADAMAGSGDSKKAAELYGEIYNSNDSPSVKIYALRGVLATDRNNAHSLVAGALKSDSPRLRAIAAASVAGSGGEELLRPLFAELNSFPTDVQAGLLGSVNDKALLKDIVASVGSHNEGVRIAALDALRRLGDAGCLPLLIRIASSEQGAVQTAARSALQSLRDKGVDHALASMAKEGPAASRVEAIRTLRARGVSSSSEVLLKLVSDPDPAVSAEAVKALDDLASADNLPVAVKLLATARPEDAGPLEQMVIAACRRAGNKEAAASTVAAALQGPDAAARSRLVRVLSKIQSAKSLGILRTVVGDAEPAVRDASVRGLSEWPDAEPLEDVLKIAVTSEDRIHKVIALRAALRMIALPSKRSVAETMKFVASIRPMAVNAEDKKLALAVLAGISGEGALAVAVEYLSDKDVEIEAAAATVQIARTVRQGNPAAAAAAVNRIMEVCKAPEARRLGQEAQALTRDGR